MLPDLIHLLFVVFIMAIMFASTMVIICGYRVPQVSSLGEAIYTYSKFFLTADDSHLFADALADGVGVSSLEKALVGVMFVLSVFVFVFTFGSFFLTIILVSLIS